MLLPHAHEQSWSRIIQCNQMSGHSGKPGCLPALAVWQAMEVDAATGPAADRPAGDGEEEDDDDDKGSQGSWETANTDAEMQVGTLRCTAATH